MMVIMERFTVLQEAQEADVSRGRDFPTCSSSWRAPCSLQDPARQLLQFHLNPNQETMEPGSGRIQDPWAAWILILLLLKTTPSRFSCGKLLSEAESPHVAQSL